MNTESLNTTSVTIVNDEGIEYNGIYLERFPDFCAEIAKHLEGNWKVTKFDTRYCELEWEEKGYGMRIWATHGRTYDFVEKLSISYTNKHLPEDTYWAGLRDKLSDINCSVKKGAAKIARDIENRFLPEYERQFVIEWEKEAQRSLLQTEIILIINGLCKLAKLCPTYKLREAHNHFGRKENEKVQLSYLVSFEVCYRANEVDVHFKCLTPLMAKKMLEAWNQLCEEEGLEPKREPELEYED